jgi:hypothetical protein
MQKKKSPWRSTHKPLPQYVLTPGNKVLDYMNFMISEYIRSIGDIMYTKYLRSSVDQRSRFPSSFGDFQCLSIY